VRARCFVGEDRVAALPTADRGLAYGDGLFETMRAHRGDVPWWDAHWARLRAGADRLGIAVPRIERVRAQATELLDGGDGVLKLIVTRGSGGRAYAPPPRLVPDWVLSVHPLPTPAAGPGLRLRWCRTRLGVQPALAGMKHCNRLEQVLARAEWDDPACDDRGADDGLMCSIDGDVVCATAANVFVLRQGQWSTPRVDRCGVAGVMRAWAMAQLQAVEARIEIDDVLTAEAVYLCNAVRGILPVARLAGREWPPHPRVTQLRRRLAVVHPAFSAPSTESS